MLTCECHYRQHVMWFSFCAGYMLKCLLNITWLYHLKSGAHNYGAAVRHDVHVVKMTFSLRCSCNVLIDKSRQEDKKYDAAQCQQFLAVFRFAAKSSAKWNSHAAHVVTSITVKYISGLKLSSEIEMIEADNYWNGKTSFLPRLSN